MLTQVHPAESHPLYEKTGAQINRLQSLGIPAKEAWISLQERKPALNGFAADRWVCELYEVVKPLFRQVDYQDFDVVDMAVLFADRFSGQVSNCDEGLASWHLLELRARELLDYLGLPFPNGASLRTQLARLENPIWWRRQLSLVTPRIVDQTTRKLGQVSREDEIYLSDAAFAMYQRRCRSSRLLLDDYQAVNDWGQVYTLAELADLSISNPVHRRVEMMVRCRGLDERAQELGWQATFVTLTAPSKYHRFTGDGECNEAWNGTSPRDVHEYLAKLWARVRSRFSDHDIDYYGVRVVEPHHDGCPHWHLLIYSCDIEAVETITRRYAMAEDSWEAGARQHRCKFERIDPSLGSGVGDIAKYVSKSIDGYQVAEDRHGRPAEDSAKRVTAWCRIWGIRQFQFFGTGAIGVYRELRRVRNRQLTEPYAEIWQSADTGCYRGVMEAMDHGDFRLHREPWSDEETGECDSPFNGYGELKPLPIRGVVCDRKTGGSFPPLYTRLSQWSIERIPREEVQCDGETGAPWTCVNNCTPTTPGYHSTTLNSLTTDPPTRLSQYQRH